MDFKTCVIRSWLPKASIANLHYNRLQVLKMDIYNNLGISAGTFTCTDRFCLIWRTNMKIVINTDFGGFSISKEAAIFMAKDGCHRASEELKDEGEFYGYGYIDGMQGGYERTSSHLVLAVETLKEKASGSMAFLKVVEIPDDTEFTIENYDGSEWVAEKHKIWQ